MQIKARTWIMQHCFISRPLVQGRCVQNVPRHFLSALCNLPARQHELNNKSPVWVLCDHISGGENRKTGWERERESSQLWGFVNLFTLSPFKPPESRQLLVRVCVCVIPVVCARAKLGVEAGGGGGWRGSVWREKMWVLGGGGWCIGRSWTL